MEAAIAWLLQTILEILQIDKLDAWIRQVGLADDVRKLKSEIWGIKIAVSIVKERGIGNELLAEPLALLQDHLYEADDVVDELDYYRLQQQVQGVTMDEPQGMRGVERVDETSSGDADTPMNTSVGKLRSVVWKHFTITERDNGRPIKAKCTYCREEFKCDTKANGTSSMKKHLANEHSMTYTKEPPGGPQPPNPSSAGEPIVIGSSSRRKGKKRWSKAWDHFDIIEEEENGEPLKARCRYCTTEINCRAKNGTGGMLNHNKICKEKPRPNDQPPNPSSTGDASANVTPIVIGDPSNRKRRRVNEESAQIMAANTQTPWDKTILSNMIRKITSQLQNIREQVSEVLKLHGSDSASSSNHHQSTGLDQHLRTSSLVPRKMYGRVAEKNSIIKMITEHESDGVAVLPIVGIAGVGKTVLAQLVYNDLDVKKQFHHRIWVWVSRNFDEVRLTTEMINFVSRERHEGSTQKNEWHEGIKSFVKLQEILKEHMEYQSEKFLLILDDIWDNFDDYRWNKLLAPLISSDVKGNVILVTTRNFSVAQKIGTLKPVKVGALANDDFWLLFESRAFGNKNCERRESLSIVGRQIVEKLKGNPLAAETAGALLRKHLSVKHWSNILINEEWKSLELSRGIMPALKLSYDQLPYHLQQCSSCSIFPDNYQFLGEELVRIWISQGFVKCNHSSKRLEEIGQFYLTDLVNLGFFQQVEEEEEESSLGSQSYYICGVMHDFARMVSRIYSANIDGLQCTKMLPTIHHLSVVTDSAYIKDRNGHIPRNESFEEKLRNTVTPVRKLRTLVLIGQYDSHFFQVFQNKFRMAHNLRLLQMSATSADFNSLMSSLVSTAHLRYLKRESDEVDGAFPQILRKLYHLQVLVDVRLNKDRTVPNGLHNLVSMRHLVVHKGVYSSIGSIGNMTSIQELHDFKVENSSGFEITQLQSMNELVELGVSQLDNVKTREEAYGAGLRNKEHLEELRLSWKDILSDEECSSDARDLLPMDDGGPSSEPSMDTAREVLEGLEPHMDLKHLQISGYNGTTSPTWLASNISVTSLQRLHLDHCGGWRILPSLESLPFLTKLKLRSMQKVTEVLVPPSLEELVLIKMPKLVRCSSTSVEGLSSSLRVLQIEKCHALKEFDLFENDDEFEKNEQRSWLPGLRKLILLHCPRLEVLNPLPPSTTVSKLLIRNCPHLTFNWSDEGFFGFTSLEKITIQDSPEMISSLVRKDGRWLLPTSLEELDIDDCSQETLHPCFPSNLTSLKRFKVRGSPGLESLQLHSCTALEELKIRDCEGLESLQLHSCTALEELKIRDCECLESLQLHSCTALEELKIRACESLTALEGLQSLGRLRHLTLIDCPRLVHKDGNDDQQNGRWLLPTSLEEVDINFCCSQETLHPCFPSNLTSLKRFKVRWCPFLESLQLHSCTALEELKIRDCEGLESLQLHSCTALEELKIRDCECLESLQLHSCTALEELKIRACESLTALEGLQSLGRLRHLTLIDCPRLVHKDGNDDQQNGRWLLPTSLEEVDINFCCSQETLHPCFPSNLTSLKRFKVRWCPFLESLQLHSCTALEELKIRDCEGLESLQLHSCTALEELKIRDCECLESLQLHSCTALEELKIRACVSLTALEGLQSLGRLRHLTLFNCPRLVHKDGNDDQQNGRWLLPTSLEELDIDDCCSQKTLHPCFPSNLTSLKRFEVQSSDGLESLELHSCTALEELKLSYCESLTAPEGLQSLGRLRNLTVSNCPRLVHRDGNDDQENGRWLLPTSLEGLAIEDCCSEETLHPCFPSNLTSLKRFEVWLCPGLKSLQLHSCTALEELKIRSCKSLTALEGLQSLGRLRHLTLFFCPGLLESFSRQGHELFSRLETLEIDDPYVLTTSICQRLTSLRRLKLVALELLLTEEQKRALVLLKFLQELEFCECTLPDDLAGLHLPPYLKRLKISSCWPISRLPETGLPLSLEEVEIFGCSKVLADKCRLLATDKLKVRICGCW